VQGGFGSERPPKFDAARESREFQAVYALRQGKPARLEEQYAQCVHRMFTRLQIPYTEAAHRLKQAAGDCMAYHTKARTGTQFIPFPENFLEDGSWETDWLDAARNLKFDGPKTEKEIVKQEMSAYKSQLQESRDRKDREETAKLQARLDEQKRRLEERNGQ
jgi:hypothetical protein